MKTFRKKRISIIIGLLAAMTVTSAQAAPQTWNPAKHTFSINDLQGGFSPDGVTEIDYVTTPSILCTNPAGCAGVQPLAGPGAADGGLLWPHDNEFGFDVVDFAGAVGKTLNEDYLEGFVNNYVPGTGPNLVDEDGNPFDEVTAGITGGLMVSNSDTALFKTPAKRGTWCAGLGGTAVKCST